MNYVLRCGGKGRNRLLIRITGLSFFYKICFAFFVIAFPNAGQAIETRSLPSISSDSQPLQRGERNLTGSLDRKYANRADPCLSFLKTIRHAPAHTARYNADQMDRTRRAAGKATALGLVFGLRIALGPKQVTGKTHRPVETGIWAFDKHGSTALAVADYRKCKNEKALKALEENWRWAR